MTDTVLGSVCCSYQLLWSQLRALRGVQLFVGSDDTTPVDALHLLNAISALWPDQAPTLLLSIQSTQLLSDVLTQAPASSRWFEVHESQLRDPALAGRVQQAYTRGLKLIWRGEPGRRPSAALAPCFLRTIITLTPEEALAGLRVSLRKHNGADATPPSRVTSPVLANQIYESVASWVLAEHCLDQQDAWAVAGWPVEDVLHGYRNQRIQCGQRAVMDLIEAIDADESSGQIEHLLTEDPMLAYRFMRYANSAGLGLRNEVGTLGQGLSKLGFSVIRSWLLEQLPHACSDMNLQPVRIAMVLRARLMAQMLLDAGESHASSRDIFLCGLLSQIDLLLGEPLSAALKRLQLSERVTTAILRHSGPYVPCLDIATALESHQPHAMRELCDAHQMDRAQVNRALLRTLGNLRQYPAKGLRLG